MAAKFTRVILAFWAVQFLAWPAEAHDAIPGIAGFPGRVLHPFIITEHLLCLILASLIIGAFLERSLLAGLGILVGGLVVGFAAQIIIPIIDVLWMLPLGAAFVAGLLVLAGLQMGERFWIMVIFGLGFAVGLETDPEEVYLIDFAYTLAGLIVAASLVHLLIGTAFRRYQSKPMQIFARVLASWVSTIAALVLALNFQ